MAKKPSQRERVLTALRDAGSRGVHTFELRQAFIGNPSQRIADLEELGFVISHTRERLHGDAVGSRYTLVSEPGTSEPRSNPMPVEPPAGFGISEKLERKPRLAIFDDEDWAA